MWWEFDIRQFYVTILTVTLGAIVGLLRIIFTSKNQIAQMRETLQHLERGREKRDEQIDEQLSEIRMDIKNLLSRKG